MDATYRTVLAGPQSVLGATLVVLGSEHRCIEAATGLDLRVQAHRYADDAHGISVLDADRIAEVIRRRADSDPDFLEDHAGRRTAAAHRLIDRTRALADGQATPGQLLESFADWAEAMKSVAPFALLTSVAGLEPGGSEEPATRRELRSFYRLALAIFDDGSAAELLRTTSAAIGLRRMQEEHPGIHGQITRHADTFGWLRSQTSGEEPMTAKDVVDRLQVVALRWAKEDIEHLAGSQPDPGPFGIDVLRQAESVARPFYGMIAATMGCTTQQVLFSSPLEIEAALSGASPLPTGEIDRRVAGGFIVQRSDDDLEVLVDPAPSPERVAAAPLLGGMTGCRGRAVGPVRVIRGEADLDQLQLGDVLVTAASTTDMMGGSTVFPTRGGGPPAVAKAIAVVADEGGLLSHAAIVCRERGIPCVLGTEFATGKLKDGQVVEVDATRPNGVVLPYEP